MNILINDIKYALRQLRRNPGFSAMVVLTLALCISVNTAMLGVLYRVVLKPLPYVDSEQLAGIQIHHQASNRIESALSASEFEALTHASDVFSRMAAFSDEFTTLSGIGMPWRTWGVRITPEFLATLGVSPVIGRAFSLEDYASGQDHLVLLSNRLWHERFGGKTDVLGKDFLLDGQSVTICGVMPPGFCYPRRYANYWRPLILTPEQLNEDNDLFLGVFGRLQPGITLEQMGQRLQQLSQGLSEQQAGVSASGINFVGQSLLKKQLGGAERILWILFGAVSCVTLIGSANLINLYLTRLGKRRKELVVRRILGAGNRHILRQWLTESSLLSLMAGLLGVMFSVWFIHLLRFYAPYGLPRAEEIAVDPVIVTYGFMVSLLVGVGMAVIPLLHILRKKENANLLKSRESESYAARPQSRSWLVGTQVTIATVLLISAGLLWNSFRGVMKIDPGFASDKILTARIVLSGKAYDDDDTLRGFYRRLTDRVESFPEVGHAGLINALPLADINFNRPFTIENRNPSNELLADDSLRANYSSVSTNYFQLMDIPILAGRMFRPTDEEGEPVVIINQSLARHYFPQGQAVGQRIKLGPGNWRPWMTIVGVSADVKNYGREAATQPIFYVPYLQKAFPTYTFRGMFLVANIHAPAELVINRIRNELYELDPSLALANIETMDARLKEDSAHRRYHSTLMGLFAGLALILAMIGIFGVLSCLVTQRRREIGIRMALGSNRVTLFRLVLKQGLRPVLAGVLCGWALSWALQNLIEGFLFGVSPNDPVTFFSVAGLFLITAGAACLLPAYRAAKIDPMEALRYE